MKLLSLFIFRTWYRRAAVMPRPSITHSEPSKFIPGCLSFGVFPTVLASFLLASFFIPSLSCASQTVYSASSQSNSLDNTNEAARPAAMGSAFTGVADDASALFSNPAGLGFLKQGQLFLNSDFWLVGTFQETALFGMPTAGAGGIALAVHYLDYGLFEGRDELGSVTANYSADRLGLDAGWGYEVLKNLSLGVGFSGAQATLAGQGYTYFTTNIGVLWKNRQGFGLGASYVNTGWVSPGGASEDAVNLGASFNTVLDSTGHLLMALGGSIEPSAVNYLQAGAEYSIQDQVFLRAGCQAPLSDQAIGGLTDLTAGVGFHLSDFSLDYSFLPYGDLGAVHRVNVGYFFESGPPKGSSIGKNNSSPGSQSGLLGQKGNGLKAVTAPGMAGSPNPSLAAQGLPPLPPNPIAPSLPQAPAPVTVFSPAAPVSQFPTAAPSGSKDSLVVQFDLPDNSAPSGAELEKEGKTREALAAYIEAVKQNPGDAASWYAMGNLYRQMSQKAYAIQCFGQVLRLEPNNQKLADWLEQYKASNP